MIHTTKKIARVTAVAVSYKRLWKLLIDRGMKKKALATSAQVSHHIINKLTNDDNVITDVLE